MKAALGVCEPDPLADDGDLGAGRRHRGAGDDFPQQVLELLGFLDDEFPQGHPYRDVHAVPGPWQAEQNEVVLRAAIQYRKG